MAEIDATGDRWEWLDIDRKFHLLALSAAPMPHLLRTIDGLWNVAARYRNAYTALAFPSHIELQHAEHRLLLHAIEQRNVQDGERILGMHIRRTRVELLPHAEIFRQR
jgi:DNA-binding GntR family transcriptional regulator